MRILVAVDFGLYGEAQIKLLKKCPCGTDTEVRVLHVIEPLVWEIQTIYPSVMTMADKLISERREAAEKLIEHVVLALTSDDTPMRVDAELRDGNPAEEIIQAAESWKADLVMVGSHGRKGFDKFLMGSVSQAVSSHAKCSVLIARQGS